jgi:hypothetical protein
VRFGLVCVGLGIELTLQLLVDGNVFLLVCTRNWMAFVRQEFNSTEKIIANAYMHLYSLRLAVLALGMSWSLGTPYS